MSLPKKEVEMMTCAQCGRQKAWHDGFPNSVYAVCWKCNCDDHYRTYHPPKKPSRWTRFRAAWKDASKPAPLPASFDEREEAIALADLGSAE